MKEGGKGSDQPTVGLIGVGRWGKNLARNFHGLGALRTICDLSSMRLTEQIAELGKLEATSNYRDLLRDPAIRQIAIATPPATHYPLARAALEAGKDLFVEKPLCLTLADALDLRDLAEEREAILMVGHILRYHPALIEVERQVEEGGLGDLLAIEGRRAKPGRIPSEKGVMWSFAPHDLSLVSALLPETLPTTVSVFANGTQSVGEEDAVMMILGYEGGLQATLSFSWLSPRKEQRFLVVGSKATLLFDDTLPWEEKLTRFPCDLRAAQVEPLPTDRILLPLEEPLANECRHFLECCEERRQPQTGIREGLRVLALLEAAQQSAAAGGEPTHPTYSWDEGSSLSVAL